MVAARKVESKNEETQEKVRARATVTSNPGEGMAELSQQIAKLMATMTQTRQGSIPPVPKIVPWNVAMVVGAPQATQTPAMGGVALVRQPQPAGYPQNEG